MGGGNKRMIDSYTKSFEVKRYLVKANKESRALIRSPEQ